MDKLISVLILVGIIIVGFISKMIELKRIVVRIDFTENYRNKFVKYVNDIISDHHFNQQLYYELTSQVKEMQYELGEDGIYAYLTDNLNGYITRNYQLLINLLPETRNMINKWDNELMISRHLQVIQDCDDMFVRHLGTLESMAQSVRKGIFNPFVSFAEGIKTIILLPFLLLNWFGFVSKETTYKARHNILINIINFIITIIGFISGIITIIIGWNDFCKIVFQFLNSVYIK